MFSAVLDTSVLVPSVTRDVLLEVASCGVYRPVWSDLILAELTTAVDGILEDKGVPQAERGAYLKRLMSAMHAAFPDARVEVSPALIRAMDSPDLDDRHVIAAAVVGRADVIVTADNQGFPRNRLPAALLAQTPDIFLTYSIDLHPAAVTRAVANVAGRTGRHGPRRSLADLINMLEQRELTQFAAELRQRL
jgi:predicted nucleic acid-binding protein